MRAQHALSWPPARFALRRPREAAAIHPAHPAKLFTAQLRKITREQLDAEYREVHVRNALLTAHRASIALPTVLSVSRWTPSVDWGTEISGVDCDFELTSGRGALRGAHSSMVLVRVGNSSLAFTAPVLFRSRCLRCSAGKLAHAWTRIPDLAYAFRYGCCAP
ncbi:hypothetical protein B0H17DRAFT_1216471 [Mycena rosella]|uniref:Uncharacterized protein n=1 Tax=Mycena rosella TaxID=1033263 RepID=A0AAD7FSK9_MYCRO|nr:hypothetical protein B0H17DRAFT_1216471 [Mycena rosella]